MTDSRFSKYQNENQSWVSFLENRVPMSSCHGEHHTKWLVIGAGLTGLSAARRLAKLNPDDTVMLLDAREIGQSASGRNSGFAVAHSHFPGHFDAKLVKGYERIDRLNIKGLDILRSEVSNNNIECDWQEDGFYHAAADKKSLMACDDFIDYLEHRQINFKTILQEELKEQLGTLWYQKAVKVGEGVLINPTKLLFGLAESIPKNVTLYENSPVITLSGKKQITLKTPHASIKADKVLMACNYEATHLNHLKQKILGITLTGSFTRRLTDEEFDSLGKASSWGVLSLHGGGATLRLTKDRRIALRNTAEYNKGKLFSVSQMATRIQIHRQAFENRFPQLKAVPFEESYSCVEGVSANKTNFFKKLSDNLFVAGGFNGSGISKGVAFGTALAEYASSETSELISDCLQCPNALRMPPSPMLGVGARFLIRQRFNGVGKDR